MNPQTQLFQLLAEVNARRQQTDLIGKRARSQASDIQAGMLPTIQQLRQQIEAAGIGTNPALEDEYLDTLRNWRRVGQVGHRASEEKVDTDVSIELQKALSVAQLMKSVYSSGDRNLAKSAEVNAVLAMLVVHGIHDEELRGLACSVG